jgi:hypothetical protein
MNVHTFASDYRRLWYWRMYSIPIMSGIMLGTALHSSVHRGLSGVRWRYIKAEGHRIKTKHNKTTATGDINTRACNEEKSKIGSRSDLKLKRCLKPGRRGREKTHSFPLLERRVWYNVVYSLSTTKGRLRRAGKWYIIRLGARELARIVNGNWLS